MCWDMSDAWSERERDETAVVSCKGGGGRGGCLLCGRDIHGGSWMYQCCMVDIASNLVPGLEAVWWRAEGRRGEHG